MAADTKVITNDPELLDAIGRSWGWVMFFGIATAVIGALVVARPEKTILFLAVVLGIWMFIAGLFRIVVAIADKEDSGGVRVLMVVLGLLSVVLGVLFFRHTEQTVSTIAFLVGLFWIIGGIIEFAHAAADKGVEARTLRIVMGILSVIAGIVTVTTPHITITVFGVIMGIWLLLYAVLLIVLSLQLRKLKSA